MSEVVKEFDPCIRALNQLKRDRFLSTVFSFEEFIDFILMGQAIRISFLELVCGCQLLETDTSTGACPVWLIIKQ